VTSAVSSWQNHSCLRLMETTYCTVHNFRDSLDALKVSKLAKQSMGVDWKGAPLHAPLQWSLASDPRELWVNIELPAPPNSVSKHNMGDFVEGLWLSDVVELFLLSPDGRYQEWNISVDGAWWSMCFSTYREAVPHSVEPQGVRVWIERSQDSWQAVFSVPHSSLGVPLDITTSAHISGIIYQEGVPTYLSSAGARPSKPDFHDPRHFRPLQFVTR
jgi:hypothetical protein